MRQVEQERWGHFLVRVRQAPMGTVWEIESLTSGARASFQTPEELLTFIRSNLKPGMGVAPCGEESETP